MPLPARARRPGVGAVGEVLAHLRRARRVRPVFVKDILDYRYAHLFDHPEELAGITHTFIVRDPKPRPSARTTR